MQTTMIIRWCGLAAIIAGILRTLASFLPFISSGTGGYIEILYTVIDILILFGLIGIYGFQKEKIDKFVFAGFITAMIGTLLIILPVEKIGSVDLYTTGAMIISIGMLLLAIGTWRAGILSRWAPALWIVSTLVGVGGFMLGGDALTYAFFVAGISFGLGFTVAGGEIWSKGNEF